MERDAGRIDPILAIIRKIWLEYPNMRLGQLIVNAVGPSGPCPEVFSIEDTALVRKLESLAERLRRSNEPSE